MTDERTKMLLTTIKKLYHRSAKHNIQRILVKTHAADIAVLLEGLKNDEAYDIFMMEPSLEKRADILSRLEEDSQQWFLEKLERPDALELLSRMEPDDVADILGHLPEEDSKELLDSMQREDSEEVADLLGYPEDSAGGLMNSDFLALHQSMSVKEAVKAIQQDEENTRIAFYIYVINESETLVGVVSLKQLLLSRPSDILKDLMSTSVISVDLGMNQEDVAQRVERYDFLSIPVVDDTNKLMGVITVDDVIDVIREEAEEDLLAMGQAGYDSDATVWEHMKARLPWLGLAFLAGAVGFVIIYSFGYMRIPEEALLPPLWLLSAFVPLMLGVGTTTGSQAATVAVGLLRTGHVEGWKIREYLFKELVLSLVFSLIFGGLIFLMGVAWFSNYNLTFPFSGAMALQILISMVMGSVFPIILQKLGFDPTVAPLPIFTAVADISAIAVLFGLYHAS